MKKEMIKKTAVMMMTAMMSATVCVPAYASQTPAAETCTMTKEERAEKRAERLKVKEEKIAAAKQRQQERLAVRDERLALVNRLKEILPVLMQVLVENREELEQEIRDIREKMADLYNIYNNQEQEAL